MTETTHTLTLHSGRVVRLAAPDLDVAIYRAERAGFKVHRPVQRLVCKRCGRARGEYCRTAAEGESMADRAGACVLPGANLIPADLDIAAPARTMEVS